MNDFSTYLTVSYQVGTEYDDYVGLPSLKVTNDDGNDEYPQSTLFTALENRDTCPSPLNNRY